MMRKPALWLALAPVLCITSVAAFERGATVHTSDAAGGIPAAVTTNPGVILEMEIRHPNEPNSTPTTVQAAIEGQNVRMRLPGANGQSTNDVIFHGDKQEMVMVDHQAKSYMVMDQATIDQLAGQMGDAMAKMQEAMKNVPESQRAMMEKMMKERMGAMGGGAAAEPVTVRNTGERATQNGYQAVKYDVLRGSKKVRELWVTDWRNIQGASEARPAFEAMAKFGRSMMESFQKSGLPMANTMDSAMFDVGALNGFPVLTRELDEAGKVTAETALKNVRQEALGAAEFQPPAGYQRRQLGGR